MPKRLRMMWVECLNCSLSEERLVDTNAPEQCPECDVDEGVEYIAVGCPMQLKASYPDGRKRFSDEKVWSKLNLEKYELDYRDPDRKRIEKEQAVVRKKQKEC